MVEHQLSEDGATRVTVDRAARWAASGADVCLMSVFPRQVEWPVPASVRMVRGSERRRGWAATMVAAVWRAHRWARTADVVVSGRELGNGLLVARAASLLARRRFAITVQSRWDLTIDEHSVPGTVTVSRWALRSAHLLVAVSEGLAASLVDHGARPSRVVAVANGIDVRSIRESAEVEPDLQLPAGILVVGVGRLAQQKGFDLLIRAHAGLVADGAPPHHVVILGDGPERERLENLAAELGVAASVHLPGAVDNPHPVVARAGLVAVPSRFEGWSLSLAEAVALGRPTIAADCVAGPREVLQQGEWGQLVPVDDVDALTDAIRRHLLAPHDLERRAALGARAARSRWDLDEAAARHLEHLDGLSHRLPRRPAVGGVDGEVSRRPTP